MLYLEIGGMGCGKTYTLVDQFIVPALQAGRTVIHNVAGFPKIGTPMIDKAIAEGRIKSFGALYPCDFPQPELDDHGDMKFYPSPVVVPGSYLARHGETWRRGALVIIDEYYVSVNRTLVTADDKSGFYAFLRAHRHFTCDDTGFGFDLVIAAQNDTDLPPQLREIVGSTIFCRPDNFSRDKLERVTFEGFIRSNAAKAAKAAAVYTYTPRKKIFNLYNSYAGVPPTQSDASKRVSYWGRLRGHFIFLAVCLAGLVWLWTYLLGTWFGGGGGDDPFSFSPLGNLSAPVAPSSAGRGGGCLFLKGAPGGFVLDGDCDYPDGHLLLSEGLEQARSVGVRPAPDAAAPEN